MIDFNFKGDFAEFTIGEINSDIASHLINSNPTSNDILSIIDSSNKFETYRGFKMNTSIESDNQICEIDEMDNVERNFKRIPIKGKTTLFYGIAWKQDVKVEFDVDDNTSIYELPLNVTEYRINKKVRFELLDIPNDLSISRSDILIVESASLQFPNNHVVEVISVRNDN